MSLKDIFAIISKGAGALENEEFILFAESFNNQIADFNFSSNSINIFTKILEELYPSDLANLVASNLKENVYYSFGLKLLKRFDGSTNFAQLIWGYLNLLRNPKFLVKIYQNEAFENLIFELVKISNFNIERLFNQRVKDYSDKPLFFEIKNNTLIPYRWKKASKEVSLIKRAFTSLLGKQKGNNPEVAFILENEIKTILLDIACLTGGVVNVVIPANSVAENILFILKQTKVKVIFVSGEKQLFQLTQIIDRLPDLKTIVMLNGNSIQKNVISFEEFLNKADKEEIGRNILIDQPATIMYTSGTTGSPKGIVFSNLNLVYKRFCRALALPWIGDRDRFLSYLPLFHTFGRYLEMLGSIFWGAEYVKMENPSLNTLLKDFQIARPTIFISVPKKWIQLYEYISKIVNVELDPLDKITDEVKTVTGGKLKWGLSAAGFLPPEIFEFFQENGIELMSGFGMTEATGGITMTPPGKYKLNSLGKALPGIKIKLKDDGELMIKGGYVMKGYYGLPLNKSFDKEGWFATGDVMLIDKDGFVEIIDRKKEIYKNIKGETIAPQKIENYFKDFESVKHVFLVGDHKPFNTALIYPNYSGGSNLNNLGIEKLRDYFSSLIVSVNKFLAPYERILDFRIINRPFLTEKGELTPKGTFKRKVIENNFQNLISQMYLKNYYEITFKNFILRIPTWFLREKGILISDVLIEGKKLFMLNSRITIEKKGEKSIRFGDYVYLLQNEVFDLHEVLSNPLLWLGNKELVDFTTDSIERWAREKENTPPIKIVRRLTHHNVQNMKSSNIEQYLNSKVTSLKAFHEAFLLLALEKYSDARVAFEFIRMAALDKTVVNHYAAKFLLKNPSLIKNKIILREACLLSIELFEEKDLVNLLPAYIYVNANLLNAKFRKQLVTNKGIKSKIVIFNKILEQSLKQFKKGIIKQKIIFDLFELFLEISKAHPVAYKEIRRTLVKYQLMKNAGEIAEYAGVVRIKSRNYFRNWLGANQKIAVDPETRDEYEWKDVIVISDEVDEKMNNLIITALTATPIIREAIFMFNLGVLIRLSDILPGGIWVSRINKNSDRNYYRITVQTRTQGAFDFVIIVDDNTREDKLKEEINWNILAGNKNYLFGFVPEFGGYWPEFKIWSVEYLEGETVDKYLQRKNKLLDVKTQVRLYYLFPYFIWSASAAYFAFWEISHNKLIIKNASPDNFIIPHHDYQSGAKIISLLKRETFNSLYEMFDNFFQKFILTSFKKYPYLTRQSVWYYLFSGLIEALGVEQGKIILLKLKREIQERESSQFWNTGLNKLLNYIESIEKQGFIPRQLFFAIKRFVRWFKINNSAEATVQAEMIDELYDTYNLNLLERNFPTVRIILYLKTAFVNSSDEIKNFLLDVATSYSGNKFDRAKIEKIIVESGILHKCSKEEKYFLTRIAYPYIKAGDYAEIINVNWKGAPQFNLVVQFVDKEGNRFFVRKPNSPREISKLHRLFTTINMLVNFKSNNEFLVAVSERGFIIGGLFYYRETPEKIHMEKIVVSHPFRRKSISEALMNELFNRSKNEGVRFITTGFFRPEYFYKFGFKVEPKYSGLVKKL